MTSGPSITGVVVQWGSLAPLKGLLSTWEIAVREAAHEAPDLQYELLVIDNGPEHNRAQLERLLGRSDSIPGSVRLLGNGSNLGFSGAVNLAARASQAEALLILNPDAHPRPQALLHLATTLARHPGAAGLVPALVNPDGSSQCRWQLRPLPGRMTLIAQALFLDLTHGPATPPPASSEIEQPAAAALLLRRQAFEQVGGMDERFFPAWFEDVDLASRIAHDGRVGKLIYCPAAVFEHALGSSVPSLGYGPFLWVYYRNLTRYLEKHYGAWTSLSVRSLLPLTALVRCLLLPLRRPSRARSRSAAARGLVQLALGAFSRWRKPAPFAQSFRRQPFRRQSK